MRGRNVLILIAALWCLSSAALGKTSIVLPVAAGRSGNGPWTVEAWPDDGCTNCVRNQADLTGVQELISDLLTEGPENSAKYEKLQIHIVRGGRENGQASFAKLKREVDGCKLGSAGMLAPNHTTDLVAFGLRIDCDKTKHSNFMSVVMGEDHVPATLYWMPDGPIVAMDVQ